MDERIRFLQGLEPKHAGRGSYLAIIEAAAGLFQQFPADAITLRDIIALSGVSNQTLYNYFPAGRDDVAIALFDRLRRADEEAFRSHIQTLAWDSLTDPEAITQALAASLARATIGNLRENFQLQSTVSVYLRTHQLRTRSVHAEELDRALQEEILRRYGNRFPKHAAAPAAQLSLHVVRGVAEVAMAYPAGSLGSLESMARRLLRPILLAGLKGEGPVSGTHPISEDAPPPVAIASAPVGPSRRQAILARIFRRGQPK